MSDSIWRCCYDQNIKAVIYILNMLYGNTLDYALLGKAINATAEKRNSLAFISQAEEVFKEIGQDTGMKKLWISYQKKFSYAKDISFENTIQAIFDLYNKTK